MKVNIERQGAVHINFDDHATRDAFVSRVSNLRGPHLVTIKPVKRRRSNPQNRYYWGVVIPSVAAGLVEAWGEVLTPDEVHVMLKEMFLSRPIVDRNTGEVVSHVYPSSKVLMIDQFTEYLEKIAKFAASSLGTVVPIASEF